VDTAGEVGRTVCLATACPGLRATVAPLTRGVTLISIEADPVGVVQRHWPGLEDASSGYELAWRAYDHASRGMGLMTISLGSTPYEGEGRGSLPSLHVVVYKHHVSVELAGPSGPSY